MPTWIDHVTKWRDCQACPLCDQRDRICLARGKVPCDVLLIGEAPGTSENAIGLCFIGPAGYLLDQIIGQALPKDMPYALTNLVACYPAEAKATGHNEPATREILACRSRLIEFVNIAQPRLIVCVGQLATQYVDHGDCVPCVDIVHPAAILRMPVAQKQMAAQKAIVQLRNAVEDVLSKPQQEHKPWGTRYAKLTEGHGLRQRYNAWIQSENDIPF